MTAFEVPGSRRALDLPAEAPDGVPAGGEAGRPVEAAPEEGRGATTRRTGRKGQEKRDGEEKAANRQGRRKR